MLGEPKMNMPNSPSLVLPVVMTIVLTISWQGLSGPLVFDDLSNLSQIFNETPPNYRESIFACVGCVDLAHRNGSPVFFN